MKSKYNRHFYRMFTEYGVAFFSVLLEACEAASNIRGISIFKLGSEMFLFALESREKLEKRLKDADLRQATHFPT